LISSMVIKEMT